MKIDLVGQSNIERSIAFDAQRTVNLIPVFDTKGKQPSALYGTPGLELFSTAGNGPIRDEYRAANGRAFVVSGNALYELASDGTATQRGVLNTSSGNVSIVENGVQLAVCDQTYVYLFTYATNIFTQVSDVDLPTASTITFIDGYFVVSKADSGTFYISGLYDGSTWDSLDFATAESSPDELLRVFNAVGQLWLFGTFTTEIWTNTGDSAFPFERISGAKMETGILAPHTAVAVDNSVFWLGRDIYGQGVVYRANGFQPKRVSNEAVEYAIQKCSDLEDVKAFTYQQDGHVYYFLTGGGLETSWVYDISTGLWHERAYLNSEGEYETHLASSCMFAFDKHLVGDRNGGNIYEMALGFYSDNGNAIARERTFSHLSDENKYIQVNSLEIDLETGTGLQSGQGSDPQLILSVSKDAGRTWSPEFFGGMGRVGKYFTRVCFRRLGIGRIFTFRIKITDPVKVSLIGAYLN